MKGREGAISQTTTSRRGRARALAPLPRLPGVATESRLRSRRRPCLLPRLLRSLHPMVRCMVASVAMNCAFATEISRLVAILPRWCVAWWRGNKLCERYRDFLVVLQSSSDDTLSGSVCTGLRDQPCVCSGDFTCARDLRVAYISRVQGAWHTSLLTSTVPNVALMPLTGTGGKPPAQTTAAAAAKVPRIYVGSRTHKQIEQLVYAPL